MGLATTEQGCGLVHAGNAAGTAPGSRTTNRAAAHCGARTRSGSLTDSLSGSSDSDCWTWSWNFSHPCEVVVELSGPSGADFDLYVNERVGSCPTTSSYTRRSIGTTSQERTTVVNPDTTADLYVLVDSFSGSGTYTLDVTEKEAPVGDVARPAPSGPVRRGRRRVTYRSTLRNRDARTQGERETREREANDTGRRDPRPTNAGAALDDVGAGTLGGWRARRQPAGGPTVHHPDVIEHGGLLSGLRERTGDIIILIR